MYPEMNSGVYGNMADGVAQAGVLLVGLILLAVVFVVLAVQLALFFLRGYALYSMAKSRKIPNAWLAWLPVGQSWTEGSLSDQYQYVVKGRNRRLRVWILALTVAAGVLTCVFGALTFFQGLLEGLDVQQNGYYIRLYIPVLVSLLLRLLSWGCTAAAFVLGKVALYDVYRSCDPSNAVLFLLLSIFIPVTEPFLLLSQRKKELGMPSRKGTQQV